MKCEKKSLLNIIFRYGKRENISKLGTLSSFVWKFHISSLMIKKKKRNFWKIDNRILSLSESLPSLDISLTQHTDYIQLHSTLTLSERLKVLVYI